MTEVQHLHRSFVFADKVIHQDRAVQELSHSRAFSDRVAHAGKAAQQIDVIEQSVSKTGGGFRVILGYVTDDLREVI